MKKGYLGLEISSVCIRFVYMDKEGQGVRVLKSGSFMYALDPAAPKALTNVIKDILTREQINPKRVFLTVTRQDALIRQITLPPMGKGELEEVVKSEIEKIPTFLNSQFEYIAQKFSDSREKVRVVFAALHRKVIHYLLSEIERTRIAFDHVEIAPLNLQELIYLPNRRGQNQTLLVINDGVGYLVIYKNHDYKLLYKTAIGLDKLYPEGQAVDEKAVSNFAGEVKRVLKSYISENKGEAVESISLIWDKQRAAGLEQLLESYLNLKIEVPDFSQESQSRIGAVQGLDNPIYILSAVPIFFFLSKLKTHFSFSHFFKTFHIERYFFKAATVVLIFLALVGYVVGMVAYNFHKLNNELTAQITTIGQEVEVLKKQSQELYARRDEYSKARQGLLDQATYVKTLNRVSWAEVFAVVATELPEDLALTSFSFDEAQTATFKGDAFQVETVADLMRKVDTSSILEKGRFDFLSEKFIEEQKVFQFGIMAQLKKVEDEQTVKAEEVVESTGSDNVEVQP